MVHVLLFPAFNVLYLYIILSEVSVQCPIRLFSVVSYFVFRFMLLMYFLYYIQMDSVAPFYHSYRFCSRRVRYISRIV
jgi:hypothetical protein